jgi:hypothetical protein
MEAVGLDVGQAGVRVDARMGLVRVQFDSPEGVLAFGLDRGAAAD